MVHFSSANFISPINTGDTIVKIKNISEITLFLIRDSSAVLKLDGNILRISQQQDKNINLDFSSKNEVLIAFGLLRDALSIISTNQRGLDGGNGISGYSGISGFNGFSGYSGENPGISGYSGYSGLGISGYSGFSGLGISGYSGQPGIRGSEMLIGILKGFNMNTTDDQLITLVGGTNFIITDVVITNASISLDTAKDFEIWNGASRADIFIAMDNSALSYLSDNTFFIDGGTSYTTSLPKGTPLPNIVLGNSNVVSNSLYASLGTAQGSPATADIYIYGYILGISGFSGVDMVTNYIQTNPQSQTGIYSTSGQFLGLANINGTNTTPPYRASNNSTIILQSSRTIEVTINGRINVEAAVYGGTLQIAYNNCNVIEPPAHATSSAAKNLIGPIQEYYGSTTGSPTVPFSLTFIVGDLFIGDPNTYWFDLWVTTSNASYPTTLTDVTVSLVELTQGGQSGISGFSGIGISGISGFSGDIGTSGISGYSGIQGTILLGKLLGADMTIDTDQLITLTGGSTFIVTDIVMTNATDIIGSHQQISGRINTGTFLLGQTVTDTTSGYTGKIVFVTNLPNLLIMSTNTFDPGDDVTSVTGDMTIGRFVGAKIVDNTADIEFWTEPSRSGYQIASNLNNLVGLYAPSQYINNFTIEQIKTNNIALYKVYVAQLTQTGTSAPTVVVLQDTIGIASITYTNTGIYTINPINTGSFPVDKTFIMGSSTFGSIGFKNEIDDIQILTIQYMAPANDILSRSLIGDQIYYLEIRVYEPIAEPIATSQTIGTSVYFSLGISHIGTCTTDIYVYGYILS